MAEELERALVIGLGEVGQRLAAALAAAGVEVVPVTRRDGWDRARGSEGGPRVLCVREDDLGPALERLAHLPPGLLVCVQNGWVRPLLAAAGAAGRDLTRGLIWFTAKGDFYRELRPSPLCGPWAEPLAAALRRGGIGAVAVEEPELAALEAEKMGFNCVVGLPLAVRGLALGEYLEQWPDEARSVFDEAVTVCARALDVAVDAGWWPAFLRAAEPIDWVRASRARALPLRNGAVVRLAAELGLAAPVNARLLAAAGG